MNFSEITGGLFEGFAMLKSVEQKTTTAGLAYLDITLCDVSGEMNAKLWDYNPAFHGEYDSGEIVKVRGSISPYKGVDQMRIERIRKADDNDNLNPSDFVPSAEYDGEVMYKTIVDMVLGFRNADIRNIVLKIYADRKNELVYWPAASRMHHAIRGGLLYHTLSIIRLAERVCEVYPYIDHELLIAGAALHDIAKIEEFDLNSSGMVDEYSDKGNLLGHLAMGAMIVEKTAEELGIKGEVPMLLQHLILSHHGKPEFGAAVRPAIIEAEILSTLDNLDATMYEIAEAMSDVYKGGFTNRIYGLDNRKFYNHSKELVEVKANLCE